MPSTLSPLYEDHRDIQFSRINTGGNMSSLGEDVAFLNIGSTIRNLDVRPVSINHPVAQIDDSC